MRGVLIDPFTKTITDIEWFDTNRVDGIYRLTDCHCITVVNLPEGDTLFVNDNGLLEAPTHFFQLGETTIAGRGLVLGCDAAGNTTDPKVRAEQLRPHIRFFNDMRFNGVESSEGVADHPVFGRVTVLRQQPTYRPASHIEMLTAERDALKARVAELEEAFGAYLDSNKHEHGADYHAYANAMLTLRRDLTPQK